MDVNNVKQQAVKFSKARSNLLLVIAFTTINMVLAISGSDLFFLFSATIPSIILGVGREFAIEFSNNAFLVAGIVISSIFVLVYLLCWAMAKRVRAFILVALIFFSIDTLLFLGIFMLMLSELDFSLMIELAFQAWVMFSLITGTIAWAKLRHVTNQDIEAAQNEVAQEASVAETKTALGELSADEDNNEGEPPTL